MCAPLPPSRGAPKRRQAQVRLPIGERAESSLPLTSTVIIILRLAQAALVIIIKQARCSPPALEPSWPEIHDANHQDDETIIILAVVRGVCGALAPRPPPRPAQHPRRP